MLTKFAIFTHITSKTTGVVEQIEITGFFKSAKEVRDFIEGLELPEDFYIVRTKEKKYHFLERWTRALILSTIRSARRRKRLEASMAQIHSILEDTREIVKKHSKS